MISTLNKYKKGKCLIDDCPTDKIYARGICISHYNMIRRLVQLKKRTWEEFEKYKMVLPSERSRYSYKKELLEKMWAKESKKPL